MLKEKNITGLVTKQTLRKTPSYNQSEIEID